jgi:DNA polymerase I-like protein with 3'-5' exonuclease and polymerase domains
MMKSEMSEISQAFVTRGFRHAWVIDTEYQQARGGRPDPHCIVAHCAITSETMRLWVAGGLRPPCPFALDRSELFIAYSADAEIGVFLTLGWPPPLCVLDLYTEYLRMRNGLLRQGKRDRLIDALAYFGEPTMGVIEKDSMRSLAMRGGPFTEEEKKQLLMYCEADVEATERLLNRMWRKAGLDNEKTFKQALWRGRFQGAVAVMRAIGVPLNVSLLKRLTDHWEELKLTLIDKFGGRYGVYVEGSFNNRLFSRFLDEHGLLRLWPRLESGALATDEKTFGEMARLFPMLEDLHQLRYILSKLRLVDLEVGGDGRNRLYPAPFRTKTSRCAPSNSGFIFGPFAGLRNLIQPPRGRALAYCDWTSQEFGVAAALSGDEAMWKAYRTGDPYLATAKLAGRVPSDATKKTHRVVRDAFKSLTLGMLYGMTTRGLARRLDISDLSAEDLSKQVKALFPWFWKWADHNVDTAMLGYPLTTRCGWTLRYPPMSLALALPRTAQNFCVQANAAEIMRYAAIVATENSLAICCSVHDAFLVEALDDEIMDVEATLCRIMGDASEAVLGTGYRIEVHVDPEDEPKITRWPNSYFEPRGLELFNTLLTELARGERNSRENSESKKGLETLESVDA